MTNESGSSASRHDLEAGRGEGSGERVAGSLDPGGEADGSDGVARKGCGRRVEWRETRKRDADVSPTPPCLLRWLGYHSLWLPGDNFVPSMAL